nr:MAG TPA_asm: hypothetical protein [Caudoviricetes sp.]
MAFGNLTDQLAILRRQDLTPTEKFVAVVALSFRNAESGRCNPPIVSDDAEKETLCSRSGYTKQCITKTLASLEAKGVLALKKAIARPSEITFTVNDVYGKGKRRLPITDKEQIKNRQVLIGDFHPRVEVQEPAHVKETAHVQETTSRCAGSCTADVQEPAHRREHIKEQEENISSSSISDLEPLTLTNDETPAACTRKKAPAVPFAQIVEIYNAKLGNDLGICRKLSETRKSVLRQRWKDVGEIVESSDPKEILSGFGCYYDKIARSSFLMGRATNFKATFDWIHKSENFIKTYEGNYENGRYRN